MVGAVVDSSPARQNRVTEGRVELPDPLNTWEKRLRSRTESTSKTRRMHGLVQ